MYVSILNPHQKNREITTNWGKAGASVRPQIDKFDKETDK
jgi:predicted DNA-binding WGR domain protein